MTHTAYARRTTSEPETAPATGPEPRTGAAPGPEADGAQAAPARRRSTRDADALAVASFVLGLVGLLVMNILLGPAAIVMALVALARSTARRGRAFLGLALGIADLVVLALLVTGNGLVAWSFGG
ncbi:DUF4190 domain-containing protein [Streptomyces sp. A0958]|uniref:DUF4190 domain-containing protein n=1 Tax=Streptomyces sp. A0958 TaxID=2563101 RepID=UPI00109E65C2|nr:DUF4190 domain-containing protein [Streptomyces sp. A0958]THA58162.1 DUF4190 domain-containing protein [Streptomyces sp. A0958]